VRTAITQAMRINTGSNCSPFFLKYSIIKLSIFVATRSIAAMTKQKENAFPIFQNFNKPIKAIRKNNQIPD
jgi:hypothetical protein